MGCPRGITDKKYDRNTLIFNFGFVFDKDCDTAPFESVVRKLGATFTIYEVIQSMNLASFYHIIHTCVTSWKTVFSRTPADAAGYQKF